MASDRRLTGDNTDDTEQVSADEIIKEYRAYVEYLAWDLSDQTGDEWDLDPTTTDTALAVMESSDKEVCHLYFDTLLAGYSSLSHDDKAVADAILNTFVENPYLTWTRGENS